MPVAESEQGSRPIRSRLREQRSALPVKHVVQRVAVVYSVAD
jgi:hypothetical protein